MRVAGVTHTELEQALFLTNAVFEDNIAFKNHKPEGLGWRVTLRCKSGKKPGHRVHVAYDNTTRRSANVCWHVYGTFLDSLFAVQPSAVVSTASAGGTVRYHANDWHWQDWNIGSIMKPLLYSEACDCRKEGRFDGAKQTLGKK